MSSFGDVQGIDTERYGRAMVLKRWGVSSQRRISEKRVLIVGVGGLGSTVALYLAGAGVGCLGIVDGDKVELSNLHRQIIHSEDSVGINKAASASVSCKRVNSTANVVVYDFYLDAHSAHTLIPTFDVIVDATDNPTSKYLLNDACVLYNKPLVSGSALYWEGQLSVFNYKLGPCYRCIFPQPPPIQTQQGCDLAGVMGPIPGLIGTLQALEVLKICGGLDEHVISGNLLLFDGLNPTHPWRSIKLRTKREDCKACGQNPTLTSLQDYNHVSYPVNEAPNYKISEKNIILPHTFSDKYPQFLGLKSKITEIDTPTFVFDVRPETHYNIAHLPLSQNWPISDFLYEAEFKTVLSKCPTQPSETSITIIFVCRRGNDSTLATQRLLKLITEQPSSGSENISINVYNLKGGLKELTQYIPNFPYV